MGKQAVAQLLVETKGNQQWMLQGYRILLVPVAEADGLRRLYYNVNTSTIVVPCMDHGPSVSGWKFEHSNF